MMILGSCSFGWAYNGLQVPKDEVFRILEYFEANGGQIVDSAHNYRQALPLLAEYIKLTGSKLQVITKIWNKYEFMDDYNILGGQIMGRPTFDGEVYSFTHYKFYACMIRENAQANSDVIDYIKDLQKLGSIQKTGMSIYYPEEIRSDMNILFIPNNYEDFKIKLPIMLLHSDVYIRSLFNTNNKDIKLALHDFNQFMQHDRPDLNHKCHAVIGVRNLNQLQEDMECFK